MLPRHPWGVHCAAAEGGCVNDAGSAYEPGSPSSSVDAGGCEECVRLSVAWLQLRRAWNASWGPQAFRAELNMRPYSSTARIRQPVDATISTRIAAAMLRLPASV